MTLKKLYSASPRQLFAADYLAQKTMAVGAGTDASGRFQRLHVAGSWLPGIASLPGRP